MRSIVLALVMFVVLIVTPAHALESLVLYDDFSATPIDPGRWVGGGGNGTEAARQIQNNRLRQFHRGYGLTTSDTGTNFTSVALNFINPSTVTAIRSKVTVTQFEATGCPSNPSASDARARLGGAFFNAGTPTPGSALDDVRARIQTQRRSTDPAGVLRVLASVFRCSNSNCTTSQGLFSNDFGLIGQSETAVLLVQWDPNNNRFIFKRGASKVLAPYAVPDAAPPSIQTMQLDVAASVANCTTAPRPVASVAASFDDVFVNSSAFPPMAVPNADIQSPSGQ